MFSGARYVVVDVGSYEGEQLPADNVVSLLVGSETMSTWGQAAAVLEGTFELLHPPQRAELRQAFLRWFELLALRAGMSLGLPERLAAVGEWIIDCATGDELLARLEGMA